MCERDQAPSRLDVVALLSDLPAQRLARGQVGSVVEELDDDTLLVEFSDGEGRAYALTPCPGLTCWFCTTYRKRLDDSLAVAAALSSSQRRHHLPPGAYGFPDR